MTKPKTTPRSVPLHRETLRCEATAGEDEQCLRERHPIGQNHTWGARGETKEWNADNTPKARPDDTPTEQIAKVDAPVAQQAADLVKAATTSNGSRGAERDFAELAAIVEAAETDRQQATLRRFEGHTLVELLSVLMEAKRQAAQRRPVDPELIRRGIALWSNWASQRDVLQEVGS